MPERVRIVQLNLAYDAAFADAVSLLARYRTLTEWSEAVSRGGADVHVIQRFARDERIERDGVTYALVADTHAPLLDAWAVSAAAVGAVGAAQPDVVHINGLMFPAMTQALRESLPHAAIVLQDHSGRVPAPPVWPLGQRSRHRWRVLAAADAVSFTARELATRWHAVGLPESVPILEILEASTAMVPVDRDRARARTRINASPAVLWIGRLNENKDPMTALAALESAFAQLPRAHGWMIYSDAPLEPQVRARVERSAALRDRVTLVGAVPHAEVTHWLSAADLFISASRHEGSGYALIEAMACGATPVVTDIPSFRAITGEVGERWPAGDAAACARALTRAASVDLAASRHAVRTRFRDHLSWNAIARRTIDAYTALAVARRDRSRA